MATGHYQNQSSPSPLTHICGTRGYESINVPNMAPRIHLAIYIFNCFLFLFHGCKMCMNIIRYRAYTHYRQHYQYTYWWCRLVNYMHLNVLFYALVGCVLLIFISDCDAITYVWWRMSRESRTSIWSWRQRLWLVWLLPPKYGHFLRYLPLIENEIVAYDGNKCI